MPEPTIESSVRRDPWGNGRNIRIFGILVLVMIAYVAAFTLSYIGEPLARAPQLDAKENLVIAGQFDSGTLKMEPIYRAVLYPYMLSLLHPVEFRPLLALLLGIACHLLNGWFVFRTALSIWSSRTAALVASGLVLLNPVLLFFAVQVLDITFATTLFLAGLYLGISESRNWRQFLASGLLLGLAVVTRPHFLPVVLLVPLAIILAAGPRGGVPALAWLPVLAIILLQGLLNWGHSGDFRILPWQGAYNLWAANRPGANGLYYLQSVDMAGKGSEENPAKAESIHLYALEHSLEEPPFSIDMMNAFWRTRFLKRVMNNPLQLAKLWSFKAYAVLNSFEQYNNLTYSFHKSRLPLLRFNPVNWGLLLILGSIGAWHLTRVNSRMALAFVLLALGYASTLVLFYASARFRVPLVPLLAVLSGGLVVAVQDCLKSRIALVKATAIACLTGLITFSSIGGIRDKDTYIQDRLLMANANAETGHDGEAARWARDVLLESPQRREALRIYAISYFNMALTGQLSETVFGTWEDQKKWVVQGTPTDPVQDAVLGIYFWNWNETEKAVSIWRSVSHQTGNATPLAHAALVATGSVSEETAHTPLVTALNRVLGIP